MKKHVAFKDAHYVQNEMFVTAKLCVDSRSLFYYDYNAGNAPFLTDFPNLVS